MGGLLKWSEIQSWWKAERGKQTTLCLYVIVVPGVAGHRNEIRAEQTKTSIWCLSCAMDEEDAELRNPFPSPPSHYTKYTSHNLHLLTTLRKLAPATVVDVNQYEILADQTDVPDWPLSQLEKPRVDWILEEPDAYYEVFGDRWFVRKRLHRVILQLLRSHSCIIGQRNDTIPCRVRRKPVIPCRS